MITGEHEFETEQGLPEALPRGERLLWQGRPDWRVLAVQALHVRKAAVYFGVLIAWRVAASWSDGLDLLDSLRSAGLLTALAVIAVGLLAVLARTMAAASLYTLTDRRVVLRIGVALSITFNLPFRAIDAVAVSESRSGHGDIALALAGEDRIAWLHLWPHARPWQVRRTQPMLRALPRVREVATLLADALARSAGTAPAPAAASEPAATPIGASRPRATAPMATA